MITTRRYRAVKLTFALNNRTKSEEMKRSNTYNRSIVQSSKSGSGSILLYLRKQTRRAQSSVQISIIDSRRCNYARKSYESDISGIAAKIGDWSCSPALLSINAEKTQPVKKNKQQETIQRTISNFCLQNY